MGFRLLERSLRGKCEADHSAQVSPSVGAHICPADREVKAITDGTEMSLIWIKDGMPGQQ
jgi:hypothetical protein